jgi:mevalonate pyrophosphate decarboxylase
MEYSIYTKPNIEGFNDVFNGYVDLSSNLSSLTTQQVNLYNELLKPSTDKTTTSITSDDKKQLYKELINRRVNKKSTTFDARLEDEKIQIEQIKYIYLAGTITIISLIILMKYL